MRLVFLFSTRKSFQYMEDGREEEEQGWKIRWQCLLEWRGVGDFSVGCNFTNRMPIN